jgi:hypothetical protein
MICSTKIFRLAVAAAALPFAFIQAPAAAAASVTITDSNCSSFSFDANSQTLSCVSGTPAPAGAPSGCTLTASPTSLPTGGGLVALTAQCTTGSPTGYNWTGGNVLANTTANTQNATVGATTTFSVTPYNASGNAAAQYATVTVSSGSTPPPTGAISCSGFNNTKVIDATFPSNGGATTRLYTYNGIFSNGAGAGWGARDAVVLRFTAPATGDQYMSVALAATGGMVTRTMNLSSNACDFSQSAGSIYYIESGSLSLDFSSGSSPYVRYVLNPGQTYYLNMANLGGGNFSCPDSTCDAVILLQNPNP